MVLTDIVRLGSEPRLPQPTGPPQGFCGTGSSFIISSMLGPSNDSECYGEQRQVQLYTRRVWKSYDKKSMEVLRRVWCNSTYIAETSIVVFRRVVCVSMS